MKLEIKVRQTLKKIKLSAPKGVPPVNGDLNTEGKNQKILVALSGGKDSAVVAYFLKKFGYNIEGIHLDLKIGKYSEECLKAVEKLCEQLDMKLHVYDIKKEIGAGMCYLRSAVQQKKGKLKNCAICGVLKKWILNREARKLKADKIATGHNLDDEAQTCLINVLKGSPKLSFSSGPITKNISDKKFVPRIKPLFYVAEEEIRKFSKQKKLPVVYDKCPCALDSYRIQVRNFLNTLPEKDKRNILENFEKIFVPQRDDPKGPKERWSKIEYCEVCGEPSRNRICKKCELMG